MEATEAYLDRIDDLDFKSNFRTRKGLVTARPLLGKD